ncbi:MAG: hypothetical protein WD044_17000 [Dongiaceae bacterium]
MTTIPKSWRQLAAISSFALLAACSTHSMEQQSSRPVSESYNASFSTTPTSNGDILATSRGLTLYTYDRDYRNKSNCYGECAENWPPFLGHAASMPTGDFTLFTRSDGTRQWAHSGQPLYTFIQDTRGGEINGDDHHDVWHVVGDTQHQAAYEPIKTPYDMSIKATPTGNLVSQGGPTTPPAHERVGLASAGDMVGGF